VLWKCLLSHHAQKHLAVPPFKPMSCVVSVLQLSIDPPPFPGLPPACYAATLPNEHFRRWNVDAVVFESYGHHTRCVFLLALRLEDACEKMLNCGAGIVCTHKGPHVTQLRLWVLA
jgi:hypothetical protein